MILGPVGELEASWNDLKGSYEKEKAALEARIEDLRVREKNALSSSDNLTQASQNLERARKMLRQAEQERQDLKERFAARADQLYGSFRIAETVADAQGRYSLTTLAPGRYQVLAILTSGEEARRWYLPVEVTPGGGVEKNLRSDETGPDPFFGTR